MQAVLSRIPGVSFLKSQTSSAEIRVWSKLGLLGCTLATLVACQLVALGAVAERIDPIGGGESCAFLPYLIGACCPEAAPVEEERPTPARRDHLLIPELGSLPGAASLPSRQSSPMREAAVPVPDETEPPCVRTYS